MRKLCLLFAMFLVIGASPSAALGNDLPTETASVTPLRNRDVLIMLGRNISPEVIIKTIKSSSCNFDTFPPVMLDLKRRGIPEEVLQAMIEAPYGPASSSKPDESAEQLIYHYAEQLKQYNLIATSSGGRGAKRNTRQARARAARTPRRRN